ncbi:MAG: hypothetical protein ACHQC8_03475 [Solirubrobacterales bacterium]
MRSSAPIAALVSIALLVAGCGAQTTTTASTASTASASPEAEAQAQHRAEAIFEREGLAFYMGEIRPSTVRFSNPCQVAKEGGEEGHEKPIAGTWNCAGWGLVSINGGGEAKVGQCEFVEGKVNATGLVGKPTGNAQTFSGSPCQINVGFGKVGKPAKASLVAAWTSKQHAEAQKSKQIEASPEGQQSKREEAKQEAEEAKRTEEAHSAERGE